jgi:hypothetical protein
METEPQDEPQVEAEADLHLLDNPEVIKWCYGPVTDFSLVNTSNPAKLKQANQIEMQWANGVIKHTGGNQWTTKLCQDLAMEGLIALGRKNVRNTRGIQSSVRAKKYEPDLECDEFVYEVKGRSWTTPGTAGEKILGVPLKYGELPKLYHKPLRIILVGYQEYEAREKFAFGDLLDTKTQTEELRDTLQYFKDHSIEYVAFTDILRKIGKI